MEYTKQVDSQILKIRWFIENCCELKLPDGKTLVIDPMLLKELKPDSGTIARDFLSDFCVDDLEGCDYVLISHVHGDHIESLREVYDKFKPTILVNGWSAYKLAKYYDIPLGAFIPLTDGQKYELGSFSLDALPARHSPPVCLQTPSKFSYGEGAEQELCWLGSLYNTNFAITLPNNYKIVLDGGWYEPNLTQMEILRPNMILRHRMQNLDESSDQMVDALQRSGAQLLMPVCQQSTKVGIDNIVNTANQKLETINHWGHVINPEPGKWIRIATNCTVE